MEIYVCISLPLSLSIYIYIFEYGVVVWGWVVVCGFWNGYTGVAKTMVFWLCTIKARLTCGEVDKLQSLQRPFGSPAVIARFKDEPGWPNILLVSSAICRAAWLFPLLLTLLLIIIVISIVVVVIIIVA